MGPCDPPRRGEGEETPGTVLVHCGQRASDKQRLVTNLVYRQTEVKRVRVSE